MVISGGKIVHSKNILSYNTLTKTALALTKGIQLLKLLTHSCHQWIITHSTLGGKTTVLTRKQKVYLCALSCQSSNILSINLWFINLSLSPGHISIIVLIDLCNMLPWNCFLQIKEWITYSSELNECSQSKGENKRHVK